MLPRDISPIHLLVSQWWKRARPAPAAVGRLRVELLQAAIAETEIHADARGNYDALSDHRVIWASHWLDLGTNARTSIHEDITANAALLIESPIFSARHAAANDYNS